MATQNNEFYEHNSNGDYINKQITVTIALEEYRDLVAENARLLYENEHLREENNKLRLRTGATND